MNAFARFLQWLEAFLRASRFAALRKFGKWLGPGSMDVDPVEVEALVGGGLSFAPAGFSGSFDPSAHSALPAIQDAAVHAIFGLFGLQYIPGEYLAILRRKPDPTDAWVEFCANFGLRTDLLGERHREEVNRLHQVVGLLVELSQLRPELKAEHRDPILEKLQGREYGSAEELLDIARTIITLLRNAPTLRAEITFPHYEKFLEILQGLLVDLAKVTKDDADEALKREQEFRDFQAQFHHLMEHLDAQIGWMLTYWPDNDWGKKNAAVKDGIIRMKEQYELQLKNDPDAHIPGAIEELQQILDDLMDFIKEIKANHDGGTFDPPVDTSVEAAWKEWFEAAQIFGFRETDDPTAEQIKKVYRRLALQWHPDRFTDLTEKAVATEKFKALAAAREVLDRYAAAGGRPKQPSTSKKGGA